MSRIGKKPIPIPKDVEVNLQPGSIETKGPKGTMKQDFPASIEVQLDNDRICVQRPDDLKQSKAFQGLTRALIANAVNGVSTGFEKSLDIVGTGYNAKLKGKHLELQIGFCLPKALMIPEGLTVEVPSPTKIIVKGCNKQLLGQFAANVRAIRPPDPYKGKGIRYSNEQVKLKASKSIGAAKA